jgi:hypothetical protein
MGKTWQRGLVLHDYFEVTLRKLAKEPLGVVEVLGRDAASIERPVIGGPQPGYSDFKGL